MSRGRVIKVRVTDAELADFRARASDAGMTVSDLIRFRLTGYHPGCMQQRNIYMVDHAQYVIAVWTGQKSGTANTLNYAKKCGRKVFCLKFA